MVVPLHHQPRVVVLRCQVGHELAPVPARPRARQTRRTASPSRSQSPAPRSSRPGAAACRVNGNQVLLAPSLEAARPPSRRCAALSSAPARSSAALPLPPAQTHTRRSRRKQLSASSAYSCRARPRKSARMRLPKRDLLRSSPCSRHQFALFLGQRRSAPRPPRDSAAPSTTERSAAPFPSRGPSATPRKSSRPLPAASTPEPSPLSAPTPRESRQVSAASPGQRASSQQCRFCTVMPAPRISVSPRSPRDTAHRSPETQSAAHSPAPVFSGPSRNPSGSQSRNRCTMRKISSAASCVCATSSVSVPGCVIVLRKNRAAAQVVSPICRALSTMFLFPRFSSKTLAARRCLAAASALHRASAPQQLLRQRHCHRTAAKARRHSVEHRSPAFELGAVYLDRTRKPRLRRGECFRTARRHRSVSSHKKSPPASRRSGRLPCAILLSSCRCTGSRAFPSATET